MAGVYGEGVGEHEHGRKNGGLRARDEGTPVIKTLNLDVVSPKGIDVISIDEEVAKLSRNQSEKLQ